MYISQAFEEFVEDVEDVTSDAPLMLWADNRRIVIMQRQLS